MQNYNLLCTGSIHLCVKMKQTYSYWYILMYDIVPFLLEWNILQSWRMTIPNDKFMHAISGKSQDRVSSRNFSLGWKWAWQFHIPCPPPPQHKLPVCVVGCHWGITWFLSSALKWFQWLTGSQRGITDHLYCSTKIYKRSPSSTQLSPFPILLSLSPFGGEAGGFGREASPPPPPLDETLQDEQLVWWAIPFSFNRGKNEPSSSPDYDILQTALPHPQLGPLFQLFSVQHWKAGNGHGNKAINR